MEQGWIKISRNITEHWLWQDSERLKWWLDLLLMASWKEQSKLVGKRIVTLQKGQIVASVTFLCKRWKRSRSMVEPFLEALQKEGMISKDVCKNISIISVLNYEKYQSKTDAYLGQDITDYYSNSCSSSSPTVDAHLDAHPDAPPKRHFLRQTDAYLEQGLTDNATEGYGGTKAQVDAHLDAHLDAPIRRNKEIYIQHNTSACARKEDFFTRLETSEIQLEAIAKNFNICSKSEVLDRLHKFELHCKARQKKHSDYLDFLGHFNNWLYGRTSEEKQNEKNLRTDSADARQRRDAEYLAYANKKFRIG